jgi:hypothetical protein
MFKTRRVSSRSDEVLIVNVFVDLAYSTAISRILCQLVTALNDESNKLNYSTETFQKMTI